MAATGSEQHKSYLGTFFVVLSAICFSIAGVLIKTTPLSGVTINGTRSILAALVMLIYMRVTKHKFVFNKTVLFGAICNTLTSLIFVISTKITSSANAIVLQFTMPIFIILIRLIFQKIRPTKTETATCVFVLIGIVFFFVDSLTSGGMLGNALALFTGITYAVIFLQKSIKGADMESSTVIGQLISFVISIPFWFTETGWSASSIVSVVVLGIFQLGLGYVFLTVGLSTVSPVTGAITSTLEPILNPILVAIFYPEHLGTFAIVGAVWVIASVTVYNVLSVRKPSAGPAGKD